MMKEKIQIFTISFFNDTATTEIYTLSLHDALPISEEAEKITDISALASLKEVTGNIVIRNSYNGADLTGLENIVSARSAEHTSELQSVISISYAVFCLKKKTKNY